jgi:DNA mismatch endonuclease (patch repair protein)
LVGVKIAIFIDGCFWHGCPKHGTTPKSNRAWWKTKFKTNQIRDRDTTVKLRKAGWKVLRVWEHQSVDAVVLRIITMRSAVRKFPSH